jgi:acetyl esterase/lipase
MYRWLLMLLILSPSVVAADRPALRDEKKERDSALAKPTFEVETIANIAYRDGKDADPVRHKLDIYVPKGVQEFPVLLFVHGGSWKTGNKEMYSKFGETYAGAGIGVVIINYRLSPKVQHPAHVEDVASAFAWTHKNIAKYGGRCDQIIVFGHSAGGQLAALLGADNRYLKNEGLRLNDLRGIIAVSGVHAPSVPLSMFRSAFGDRDSMKEASPIEHVNRRCPPFLLMYADHDLPTLGRMSEDLRDELKRSRCDVSIRKIDNRNHYTIMGEMVKEGDPARQAVLDFVGRQTGWKPKSPPVERPKRD